MSVMADGYAKFGEVFTVPLLHYNMTFLVGPSVAPHFFKATDDEMSQTEARSLLMPGNARAARPHQVGSAREHATHRHAIRRSTQRLKCRGHPNATCELTITSGPA